jgi:hypothetical protein
MSSFTKQRVKYIGNIKNTQAIPDSEDTSDDERKKKAIRLFCIYFPQFHSFKENDTNFYPGFTDILNLDTLMKDIPNKDYLSPSLKELGLNKLSDYDLVKNKNLVSKQLKLLESYNIEGFAIYYYWFSNNTLSNNKMLMKDAIDNFFDESVYMYDRKVYFIWANEDWTANKWFGDKPNKIENKYDVNTFTENINNLITYFKSPNYLKIDNSPVFFVYHPHLMTDPQLNLFKSLLDKACAKNGYNPVKLVINNSGGPRKGYIQFNSTASKSLPNQGDYSQHVDSIKFEESIQAINFDFDNTARMYKPYRNNIIKYKNVTELYQRRLLHKTVNHYVNYKKKDPVENILLINAWNEWGERMAVEPSEEKGYYFLDMIKTAFEDKSPNYTRHIVEYVILHRGGWRDVQNVMDSNLNFSQNNNRVFYDNLDKEFLLKNGKFQLNPWIGIVHIIPTKKSQNLIFRKSAFINSLKTCQGLITLAPNLTEYCKTQIQIQKKNQAIQYNIPLYTLKHPIADMNVPLFDFTLYSNNINKKIIQIGQQDRVLSSICIINTPNHEKLWLTGSKNINEMIERLKIEARELNRKYTPIQAKYTETYAEYDDLLTKNIVFIDLSAAVANNTVLECIVRNTPIIVNKIGGVPFYLGEDYPLYFKNYDDIPKLLNDPNAIRAAHIYLKNMDKTDLSIDYFLKQLKDILKPI